MNLRGLGVCLAFLVGGGGPLAGQTLPKEQDRLAWHGDSVLRIASSGRFSMEAPVEEGRREGPLDPGLFSPYRMDLADGAVWVCLFERTEEQKDILRLYRSEDGLRRTSEAWVPADLPEGRVYGLYPLPLDRYLLVAKNLFRREKEASFLAVGRRDDHQRIQVDRLIPVDLGERALEGAASEAFERDIHRSLYLGGFITNRVRGDGFLVFANGASGRLLVLDLESLNTRLVRIFPGLPDEAFWAAEAFRFEYALLGIQPRRNGHFTLATRTEQAVREARKTELGMGLDQVRLPAGSTPGQARALLKADRENPARKGVREAIENDGSICFPQVLWWDLDPLTGAITEMAAPRGAPFELRTAAEVRAFRFRINVRDEVTTSD